MKCDDSSSCSDELICNVAQCEANPASPYGPCIQIGAQVWILTCLYSLIFIVFYTTTVTHKSTSPSTTHKFTTATSSTEFSSSTTEHCIPYGHDASDVYFFIFALRKILITFGTSWINYPFMDKQALACYWGIFRFPCCYIIVVP